MILLFTLIPAYCAAFGLKPTVRYSETLGKPIEQKVIAQYQNKGNDETGMESGPLQYPGKPEFPCNLRTLRIVVVRFAHRTVEHETQDMDRNVVEHDRIDDLRDPELRFQYTGYCTPETSTEESRKEDNQEHQDR